MWTGIPWWALDFAFGIGSPSGEDVSDVITDASGNIYVTGVFAGTIDFDPGPGVFSLTGASPGEPFLAKYSPTGELIWARDFDSSGHSHSNAGRSIAVDSQGNVYLGGAFHGTMDSDPGAAVSNLSTSSSFGAGFLIKLDSSGSFVWSHQLQSHSPILSVAVDSSDNLYYAFHAHRGAEIDVDPSAGTFIVTAPSGTGPTRGYVVKVNASGALAWVRSAGGFGEGTLSPPHLAVDGSGNVYATGAFSATVDFDPGGEIANLISAGGSDIFVWKLDSAGNLVWAKSMGGTGFDQAENIVLDSSGNVYTVGQFSGTADFDPGAATASLTSAGGIDVFASKLDSSGDFVWVRSFGGSGTDVAYGAALGDADHLYVTGAFEQTVDVDPGAGVFDLASVGARDVFVWQIASSGDFVNAVSAGGTSNDVGNAIALDGNGDMIVVGSFANTADFDPGLDTANLSSNGGNDGFVWKLRPSVIGLVVTVENVPPAFDDPEADFADETVPASAAGAFTRSSLTFTDPGTRDLHTVTVNYGDGGSDEILHLPLGSRVFDLSHTYSTAGTFTVTVIVADDDTGTHSDSLTVTVTEWFPWQNPIHPCDVTDDGWITPDDVLILVNEINRGDVRQLPALPQSPETPPPYFDVSGDGWLTPLDVLLVIHYINTFGSGPIPGESSAAASAFPDRFMDGSEAEGEWTLNESSGGRADAWTGVSGHRGPRLAADRMLAAADRVFAEIGGSQRVGTQRLARRWEPLEDLLSPLLEHASAR